MEVIRDIFQLSSETQNRILLSLIIFAVLFLIKYFANLAVRKRVSDIKSAYHWRRFIFYTYSFLLIILLGFIWIKGVRSIGTFLGLISAGIAIAMHDTIANIAGWFFIIWRKPFSVGDRIQIADVKGDVIDTRLFQFSIVEIGNWVDAEQSTGRIIHIPNSKVLKENLSNYHTGFDYIWHEIPVLITFESNWKKAKEILSQIVDEKAEHLSVGAEEEIRRAAMKYMVYFKKLTPIVYTTVKDSGVMLTIRYILKPRNRRGSEQEIWELILEEFAKHDDINLAYPTTRFYKAWEENNE